MALAFENKFYDRGELYKRLERVELRMLGLFKGEGCHLLRNLSLQGMINSRFFRGKRTR